jgi:hypothetical protein
VKQLMYLMAATIPITVAQAQDTKFKLQDTRTPPASIVVLNLVTPAENLEVVPKIPAPVTVYEGARITRLNEFNPCVELESQDKRIADKMPLEIEALSGLIDCATIVDTTKYGAETPESLARRVHAMNLVYRLAATVKGQTALRSISHQSDKVRVVALSDATVITPKKQDKCIVAVLGGEPTVKMLEKGRDTRISTDAQSLIRIAGTIVSGQITALSAEMLMAEVSPDKTLAKAECSAPVTFAKVDFKTAPTVWLTVKDHPQSEVSSTLDVSGEPPSSNDAALGSLFTPDETKAFLEAWLQPATPLPTDADCGDIQPSGGPARPPVASVVREQQVSILSCTATRTTLPNEVRVAAINALAETSNPAAAKVFAAVADGRNVPPAVQAAALSALGKSLSSGSAAAAPSTKTAPAAPGGVVRRDAPPAPSAAAAPAKGDASGDDNDKGVKGTIKLGPAEHWYLSADVPLQSITKLSYNDKTNTYDQVDAAKFLVGLSYSLGDLDHGSSANSGWSVWFNPAANPLTRNLVVKGIVTGSKSPLETYGFGVALRGGLFTKLGMNMDVLTPFAARLFTRSDAPGSGATIDHNGKRIGSWRYGIGVDLTKAIGWVGSKAK